MPNFIQNLIKEKLSQIEKNECVFYACESGSRAWNFASKDSDYDVRFVYVRDMAWYLALSQKRDVIEMPILNDLDINGWDLAKFLKLAYKGNVVAFEWLKSPVIYAKSTLWDEASAVCERYLVLVAQSKFYIKKTLFKLNSKIFPYNKHKIRAHLLSCEKFMRKFLAIWCYFKT